MSKDQMDIICSKMMGILQNFSWVFQITRCQESQGEANYLDKTFEYKHL